MYHETATRIALVIGVICAAAAAAFALWVNN